MQELFLQQGMVVIGDVEPDLREEEWIPDGEVLEAV
jgi:hypothetical protein